MEGLALIDVAHRARVTHRKIDRPALPFRSVNVRGKPDHQGDMQRHHLLPRKILRNEALAAMLAHLGRERIGFDDFRRNGLLLPCTTSAALRVGLPLHRGLHRLYNAMVQERMGQIEAEWSRVRYARPIGAEGEALQRLLLLQRALRRRLLDPGKNRLRLNRMDPFRPGVDLSELDAMVEQLWSATG